MVRQARSASANEGGAAGGPPERTCAVTRGKHSSDDLIRFVCSPAGAVVPDVACRLPGRGVWLSCSRAVVEGAMKSGALAKSLRRRVEVAGDLADRVDELLVRRAIETLSLANKAGQAVGGFAKVEAAVGSGNCIALLHALEAAADGTRKLEQKLRAQDLDRAASSLKVLSSAELSLALGRPNVIHAALTKGGAGNRVLDAMRRLARYRAMPETDEDRAAAGVIAEQV